MDIVYTHGHFYAAFVTYNAPESPSREIEDEVLRTRIVRNVSNIVYHMLTGNDNVVGHVRSELEDL